MNKDLEIEEQTNMLHIKEIANKLNINEEDLIMYGKYQAKINIKPNNLKGKLILVTSINPTPFGEGKTTLTIGINDALRLLNINSVAVLREPSLGPVFGIKGGATGGGYSQIVPSKDINLHFTGDMHAITSANNLISAIIDNHIFQGNELLLDPNKIEFKRCMDMNDRILRNITLSNRQESFNITAASEIMAILCLAKDYKDLKKRISNILIGYTYNSEPIFLKDLYIEDAVCSLLEYATIPNLVQSLENNPVIVHGGPFANIAHGCNSVAATALGLTLSDYVITEAGFGSDLGAEKFFDIKCRTANLKPFLTIINVTTKALKYHSGDIKLDYESLKKGISNLKAHIDNMKLFNNNILVVLNKYEFDTLDEINYIKMFCNSLGVDFLVSDAYKLGGIGAKDIASYILNLETNNNFRLLYDLEDSIQNKINTICTKIYHSNDIIFNKDILDKIEIINNMGYSNLPICIAKTPSSLSANDKVLGYPTNYDINIKDIKLNTGSGFIIVYLGNIMAMPGLPKVPNAIKK